MEGLELSLKRKISVLLVYDGRISSARRRETAKAHLLSISGLLAGSGDDGGLSRLPDYISGDICYL